MKLFDYLNQHFFTEPQLLAQTGIEASQLHHWQQQRYVPQPSYRLRLDVQCQSFFGAQEEEGAVAYYAAGTGAWIDAIHTLENAEAACQLFCTRYRAQLMQLAGPADSALLARLGDPAHLASEWQHFLDGTYGVCTVSGLPEEIATKEWAIGKIQALLEAGSVARYALGAAVNLLDGVLAPFAPHEVARSSRQKYVNVMRKEYALPPVA